MSEHLKELREKFELTQDDISSKLGITRQNYSRWETGDQLIPLYHLNSLANYFNSSIDYIANLTNMNNPTNKIDILDKSLVGNRIKEIRIENNLSMRKFAEILNTTHSNISVYEHGKYLIIISFAIEISKKYNISLDWICGRSNNKFIK